VKKNPMNLDCPFCRAVSNLERGLPSRLQDTPLWKSQNFVVLPSVGPLTLGHVLVVSREHCTSLSSMGFAALREYDSLRKYVARMDGLYKGNLLQAEHGAASDKRGGTCIVHAHVNWLPQSARFSRIIEGVLPKIPGIRGVSSLTNVSGPYIMVRVDGSRPKVYDATNSPSQLVRRLICESSGRDDWDWATSPNILLIQETVEHWMAKRTEPL